VLGGFTWLFPRAKVAVVVPVVIIPFVFHWPALLFTALWFALQVLQGTAALGAGPATAGIAWWAHIGGFLAGLAIAAWLKPKPPRRQGPWER
jgi:membrane associated rhomboid family serine protease